MNKAIVEITSFGPRRMTWKHGLVCHNGRRPTQLKWPHSKRYLNWTNLRGCSETPGNTSRKLRFQECTPEKYLRVSKAKEMNPTDSTVTALEARCQIMLQRASTNFSPIMLFWCSFPTKAIDSSTLWRGGHGHDRQNLVDAMHMCGVSGTISLRQGNRMFVDLSFPSSIVRTMS